MRHFLLLLTLIFSLCSLAQRGFERKQPKNLKGKVNSISTIEYYAVDSFGTTIKAGVKKGGQSTIKEYDSQGNMTLYKILNDSTLKPTRSYFYRTDGLTTSSVYYRGDVAISRSIHFRNEAGHNINSIKIDSQGDTSKTEYLYNEEGKLTDVIEYDKDGKRGNQYVNTYDQNGFKDSYSLFYQGEMIFSKRSVFSIDSNLTEICNLDGNGNPTECTFKKYNEKNQLIENVRQVNGQFYEMFTIDYDDEGNRIEEKVFDEFMNLTDWNLFKYENGQMVELKEMDGSGTLSRHEIRQYDDEGNHIKTTYYSNGGKALFSHEWEYIFDDHGNWIKKIMIVSGNAAYITERVITYH